MNKTIFDLDNDNKQRNTYNLCNYFESLTTKPKKNYTIKTLKIDYFNSIEIRTYKI